MTREGVETGSSREGNTVTDEDDDEGVGKRRFVKMRKERMEYWRMGGWIPEGIQSGCRPFNFHPRAVPRQSAGGCQLEACDVSHRDPPRASASWTPKMMKWTLTKKTHPEVTLE
ncbi:unnamed protein product [Darwinula stevensoni]|uniref:Uncharacterized protein n=1 Tax=Darwinula stevensoni TaxID=69355 RepID=A0A7R8XGQ8_9CRUS|nr:unnamed protein product [Darwinula stevensoni]CAG0891932.1 unnamed protein product [Darwinula stevensoni]